MKNNDDPVPAPTLKIADGLEAAAAAGDDFLVDYVRVFDPEGGW